MILYRKAAALRIRRQPAPEPPFWCATQVSPYSPRRSSPLSIDYATMRATGVERADVVVCEDVRNELDRVRALTPPVLIDAAEAAEEVFRRGEDVVRWCDEQRLASVHLVSARGALPDAPPARSTVVIAAWPVEPGRLERLFEDAHAKKMSWGVVLPILYPVTTELATLQEIVAMAAASGAGFVAGTAVELEPAARQSLARTLDLSPEDDRYAMLFHGSLDPLLAATERHVAALAASHGLRDFVVPPEWDERTNWNAAVLLTLTASRMMALELDLDLAASIARSARAVALLEKPLTRIGEAASLGIVGGLDETSVEILTEWLESGTAGFVEFVNEQWRVRRDVMNDE